MSKRCSKCKENKSLTEFYTLKRSTAKGNKVYYQPYCKKCLYEANKAWREANRERRNQQQREGRARKKAGIKRKPRRTHEEAMALQRAYKKKRRKEDPNFKLRDILRSRLHDALKCNSKSARTLELLGASIEHLIQHLESQFLPGMSWDNHGKGEGKWQIDHIVPCASFDFTYAEQQQQCFHWTNLQPLWEKDNRDKSAKVPQNRRWVDSTTGWVENNIL